MKHYLRFVITFILATVWCMGGYAAVGDTYEVVTDTKNLKAGDVVVIASSEGQAAIGKESAGTKSSAKKRRKAISVTISNGKLTVVNGIDELILEQTETDKWYLKSSDSKYLSSDAAKTLQYFDKSSAKYAAIDITSNSDAIITFPENTNLSSNCIRQNDTYGFAYYNNTTGTSVQIYKKTSSKTLISLAISGEPSKKTYEAGKALDPTGLVVKGTYDDKSTATITDGITWAMNPATLSLNDVSCSVTATVDGVTSPAYNVTGLTVNEAKLPAKITLTDNATTLATDDEPNTFTVDYNGDGTLSATASAEGVVDLALVGKTVTVTPKAAGSVDITISATEGAEYKAASTTYTVNVVPVGIAAIRSSITSESSSQQDAFSTVKLKDAVVTYVGKPTKTGGVKTIYVEDANAGIVFYGSKITYEEGDVLNGTISGEGFVFKGLTEVTSIDASSNIVVTKNGVIPCQEVTVDELNKNMDKWESRRVKLLDVTVSSAMYNRNAEISQDGNTIAVYEKIEDCSGDLLSKENTKIASIVCYPQDYTLSSKTTNQLCIWEESDIVVATAEPTYTPATVNFVAHAGADYYATFSNANVVFMPKDVTISAVTVDNNNVVMRKSTEGVLGTEETVKIAGNNVAGYYIPANTGVLLNSKNSGEVTYYTVENKEVAEYDAILNNMLMPSVAGGEFTAETTKVYYKLAYDDYKAQTGLGFYWGAENGGAFKVKAGTAYLAVPASESTAKGFAFNGEATGIDGVNANVENGKAIYNLNGQRVASMAKPGLYIVNGKKVVRK